MRWSYQTLSCQMALNDLPQGPILIVGQGIGGTSLAWQCIHRGLSFKIIDDGHKSASSLAAAGLFNPLILKRRKLTWRAQEFMEPLGDFYAFVEDRLNTELVHHTGIQRRISSIEERNDWESLKGNTAHSKYIGDYLEKSQVTSGLSAPHGYQSIIGAGYVDVNKYLAESRNYFSEMACYEESTFHLEDPVQFFYRGKEYSHIVYAMGYKALMASSHFPDLPFKPAKGHIVEIICPSLDLKSPINGPCFVIPLGDGRFRIGSTYSWENFNNEVEQSEIDKLLASFESMCELPYSIVEKWAGVRPATNDRNPFIGSSKKNSRILIFNGLGSKAIMTTPLLSNALLDHIIHGTELWPEVSLSRLRL